MKTIILNSSGEKIVVQIDGMENKANKKLAFIAHGFAGFKEHYIVRIPADVLMRNGYVVVTFDGRHSFGESDGVLEQANITTVIEDLKTVIAWAKGQDFFTLPYALIGHSLGGGAVLALANENCNEINNMILLNSLFSGKLLFDAYERYNKELLEQWKKEPLLREKIDDPTRMGKIGFQYMTETLKYDFVKTAGQIAAPVLVITGDKDKSCPPENARMFFEELSDNIVKKIVIFKNCGHFFSKEENKTELSQTLDAWFHT